MQQLTKEQAAIIGLYTGICCGPFSDVQELAEKLAKRSIWTHEFAKKELWDELKELAKPMFMSICHDPKESKR